MKIYCVNTYLNGYHITITPKNLQKVDGKKASYQGVGSRQEYNISVCEAHPVEYISQMSSIWKNKSKTTHEAKSISTPPSPQKHIFINFNFIQIWNFPKFPLLYWEIVCEQSQIMSKACLLIWSI